MHLRFTPATTTTPAASLQLLHSQKDALLRITSKFKPHKPDGDDSSFLRKQEIYELTQSEASEVKSKRSQVIRSTPGKLLLSETLLEELLVKFVYKRTLVVTSVVSGSRLGGTSL